jgi:hypothetical protein
MCIADLWDLIDVIYKRKLGRYLSNNKEAACIAEGDPEQFHHILSMHNDIIAMGQMLAIKVNINSFNTSNDKTHIAAIMHSPEMLNALLHLINFGEYFHMKKLMSKQWVSKNLHGMSVGGVYLIPHASFYVHAG